MLIDTHCHLDFPEFDSDRDEVIRLSQKEGVGFIVNVASSLSSSVNSLELAKKYDFIYAAIGIHPHEADHFNKEQGDEVRRLAGQKKVVAVGEIGLDYYKNFSKKENQKVAFSSLLEIAKDLKLPVVLHSREAGDDTLAILKNFMPVKAVFHCFSGTPEFLSSCLEMGFFFSFTCNITYKKAQGLRDLVKLAPLERIFLETDCPYLSPEGLRGRRNLPQNVKFVAEQIALIKGVDVQEVARVTTDNAKKFFGIT